MKILICTIMRNRASDLGQWYRQIKDLVTADVANEYFLSVYENDSTDGTFEQLSLLDFSFVRHHQLMTETLSTEYFGSVVSEQRVVNLANARNRAIYGSGSYHLVDKLIFIETGISYKTADAMECIAKSVHYDILSGLSVHNLDAFEPKSMLAEERRYVNIYDTWATRATPNTYNDEHVLFGNQLILPVWSTFNCFCVYNAEPFKAGISFGWQNVRLKQMALDEANLASRQPTAQSNYSDCDTAMVCENFHRNGYSKVAIDTSFWVGHTG
jgi:hypothetical protein